MKNKSEFDSPPLRHTKNEKNDGVPETCFSRALEKHEGRIGAAVVRAANWRLMAFTTAGLAAISLCANVYLATRPRVQPYYIEVDKTGVVGNIVSGQQNYQVKENSVKYNLGQVIRQLRTMPSDRVQYKKNWEMAYNFITKNGASKLDDLMKNSTPIQDIENGITVDVNLIGVSKVTGKNNTYQVRWEERKYKKGELQGKYTMSAFITVKVLRPDDQNILKNPFGIYIDDINWSKEI